MMPDAIDAQLCARLAPKTFPELNGITLMLAHAGSGVGRLAAEQGDGAPYWAYVWPGGQALAQFLFSAPQTVRGRNVLDFGAGCGLVGIAAHLCGAKSVTFSDRDPLARRLAALNARSNGLTPSGTPLAGFDGESVVLAGDVFYDAPATRESLRALRALQEQGAEVLIGDPFRADLPLAALEEIARVETAEVGAAPSTPPIASGIFRLKAASGAI